MKNEKRKMKNIKRCFPSIYNASFRQTIFNEYKAQSCTDFYF